MNVASRREPGANDVVMVAGWVRYPLTGAKTDGAAASRSASLPAGAGRGTLTKQCAAFFNAANRFPGPQPRLCRAFRSGHQDAPRNDADDVRGSKRGTECLWTTGLDIRRSRVHRPG